MEFHEKLQELRKSRKLTQEELAEALYVSRTAISKWESGRGYPSIDSLKEISFYFSVTLDELLSSEKLLSIAEKENKANIRNMCDLLFGIVDVFSIILIILPLYPNTAENFIHSVNLFQYTEISNFHRSVYWLFFLALVITGIAKILLPKEGNKNQILTAISMTLSILIILFLALAREAYAIAVTFLLFVTKTILLLKYMRT